VNLLAFLLLALPGIDVKIDGPATAAPGDLVILQAVSEGAKHYAWTLANSDKTFLPTDGGTKAVFASGKAGKYIFVLSASDAVGLAQTKHELTIGEPEPEPLPPVPPGPTPPPTPLPDGKFKLAIFAFTEAGKVQSANKPAAAKNLANSFRGIASAIAAGALSKPEEILAKTLSGNQTALGGDRAAWSAFGVSLSTELEKLNTAGTLRLPADYQAAWDEIATGLEAVK